MKSLPRVETTLLVDTSFLSGLIEDMTQHGTCDQVQADKIVEAVEAGLHVLELFLHYYTEGGGQLPAAGGVEHERYRQLADQIDEYRKLARVANRIAHDEFGNCHV